MPQTRSVTRAATKHTLKPYSEVQWTPRSVLQRTARRSRCLQRCERLKTAPRLHVSNSEQNWGQSVTSICSRSIKLKSVCRNSRAAFSALKTITHTHTRARCKQPTEPLKQPFCTSKSRQQPQHAAQQPGRTPPRYHVNCHGNINPADDLIQSETTSEGHMTGREELDHRGSRCTQTTLCN